LGENIPFNFRWRRIAILALLLVACSLTAYTSEDCPAIDRQAALPEDIKKVEMEEDQIPPILHSKGYEQPIPLIGGVNSADGEDSTFILPDCFLITKMFSV